MKKLIIFTAIVLLVIFFYPKDMYDSNFNPVDFSSPTKEVVKCYGFSRVVVKRIKKNNLPPVPVPVDVIGERKCFGWVTKKDIPNPLFNFNGNI